MSDDDHELWEYVTRDVKPIMRQKQIERDEKEFKKSPKSVQKKSLKPQAYQLDSSEAVPRSVTQGRDVDRNTAQRFKKGLMPIDGRLDLHGMRQVEAYEALQRFIRSSYASGKRCVLVITGKGAGEDGRRDPLKSGQGVLKRKVPEWLEEEPFRDILLMSTQAQGQHGGSGALYVLLRRQR